MTWVHVQRGTSPRAFSAPAAVAVAGSQTALPTVQPEPRLEPEREPRFKTPPWLWPWIAAHARTLGLTLFRRASSIAGRAISLGPGLLRWSWRAGAAVVLVAVVVAGGSRAWPYVRAGWPGVQTSVLAYWSKLLTTLKSGTEVPVPPEDSRSAAGVQSTGSLDVQSDPAGARVLIDGSFRGVTPLTIAGLRPGSHLVLLEADKGSIQKTVAIVAGRTVRVSEGIFAGWVHVSTPIELVITEGRRGLRLDARNEILLAPGRHLVVFENRALGYREERQIDVSPGATTDVALAPPPSKLTVTATLPADVIIDGERAGVTPLVDRDVPLGTREIVVRSDSGAERRFTLTLTVKPARIDVDFSKP